MSLIEQQRTSAFVIAEEESSLSTSKFARPGLINPGQNGDLAIPSEQKLDLLSLFVGLFEVTLGTLTFG